MLIFDVHTHVFPDRIAAKAISHLRDKSHGIPAYADGTATGLERAAVQAGYSGWMNCPVATSAKQMRSLNDWCAELNHWPHLSLGGLYVDAPVADVIAEVRRIKALGLYGIKLHPEYQEFSPLDPRLAPVWETAAECGLPVLFHAGGDVGFYGTVQHSWPADYAELARRVPSLQIIAAHLGGWRDWDLVERDLCGAPVFIDTSFAFDWMPDQSQFERIIRKHGVDRVLYGTDSPWSDLKDGIREVLGTHLSDAEKHQIFWSNAVRLFHLPVAP